MARFLLPGLIGAVCPVRSPGCKVAPPDFEIRASMTTSGKDDKFMPGAIAIASVNENKYGHFCGAGIRNTANGIRDVGVLVPAARASTNNISPGVIFAASCGAIVTEPDTADETFATEAGGGTALAVTSAAGFPETSAMIASTSR